MLGIAKNIVRASADRLGYAVLDLRKDQWLGRFLPAHLKIILDALEINCVIDVGANIGQYALMLRHAGYNGRIVSVEPVPESHRKLERRASSDPAWHTMNVAFGPRNESKSFHIFAASDLSSFLDPSVHMEPNIGDSNIMRSEPVMVKSLDSVFKTIVDGIKEPKVFLKLDTQGYDLEVMKGSGRSVGYFHAIQSELSVVPLYEGMPDYLDALRYYRDIGFEPTGFFPVVNDRKSRHVLEFDAVLTRR
jgi:FkbM family methyltransferase